MDGDAPQPSTSHSSEAKDPTRSKLDRLVKKVGGKLLPKSGENIFVPSTMSPCLARTSQSPSTDESQHSLCGDAGSRTSAATNVGVPLPGLFINTFGTEAAGSGYGWLTAPDTPEPYHGVASILRAQQIGLEMVKERIRWTKQQIDTCRRDEQMIADFVADAFVDELHATSNKQKYYQVLEDIKHLENEIDELRKLSPRIVPPPRPAPPFHQSTWYCISVEVQLQPLQSSVGRPNVCLAYARRW
ncbi:hypothetical protein Q1695_009515 [Nippostrongylus brasiliensis]|nr:hypothetical protein Q1695_009515 [Nippostrongylus brasiliensis]